MATTYRVPVLEDFAWQPPVNNQVTVPTESETKGTRYIIKATATGIFVGLETKLATAKQANPTLLSHWYIDTPKEGHRCRVLDENVDYLYDAGAWSAVPDNAGLSAAISTNTADISTVSAGLSSAVAVNSTQTADISTNTANISTNTANISTNTANISTLSAGLSTANVDLSGKQDKGTYVSEYGAIEFSM